MTVETGALEQAYAKVETAYAVTPADSLSATDAIRHLDLSLNTKVNDEPSPEKRGTPDVAQMLPRRRTTTWNLAQALWEPSGTIGTISNLGKFLKAGFGQNHVITGGLTTTVATATSATSFTVTSATGLAIGDLIAVEIGTTGVFQVTRVTNLVSTTVTCDALVATPTVGGDVLAGITYQPASNITESIALYKYYNGGGYKQASYGSVVDQIQVTFDGTKEVGLAIQGPGGDYADSDYGTVQAKPGSHTTVGSPVGGMVGSFYVGGNAFPVLSAQLTWQNNIVLRNSELGTSKASGILGRTNMRQVRVQVTFYLEDRRLMQAANNKTDCALRCLVGSAAGSILAMVVPRSRFEFPDIGGGVGPKELTVEGQALATNGNDQAYLAEM